MMPAGKFTYTFAQQKNACLPSGLYLVKKIIR